jgi:chemotaxis signal transduction protein
MTGFDTGAAAALKADFDRSFAAPPPGAGTRPETFLRVRVGGERYVLRLSEVGGLFVDKRVTRLPTTVPSLMGLAGFRDRVLAVYDLAMHLGSARVTSPRWMVTSSESAVALAFDAFDGHVHAPLDRVARHHHQGGGAAAAPDVLNIENGIPVIHLAAVLERIAGLAGRGDRS